jgi:hypothetical protein
MERITTGTILARTAALCALAPLPVGLAFAALLLPWLLADIMMQGESDAMLPLASLIGVIVQYMLTIALLGRLELLPEKHRAGRVASYMGVNIVTGFGVILGLLLLILPGLYLWARWAIVTPLVIGEGLRMGQAMEQSGNRTAPSILSIMAASAVLFLPELFSLGIYLAHLQGSDFFSTIEWVVVDDVLSAISYAATLVAAVAIYELTRPPR